MSKEEKDKFAIFEKMTKRQIIDWIKGHYWHYSEDRFFMESDLLWEKYQKEIDKNQEKWGEHIKRGKALQETGWSDEANLLIKEINSSNNVEELIKLMERLQKKEEPWNKHLAESKALMAEDNRLENMYRNYMELRKRENETQRS